MDLGLRKRVALVTGASRGLGYATAFRLAEEGAHVALCARNEKPLQEAAQRIAEATQAEVLAVPCDVTEPEALEGFLDAALANWGRVDILVTNAGGPPPGQFDTLNQEQWEQAANLTLFPVVRAIRQVLPVMRSAQWGRILNITSIAVKQPVQDLLLSNAMRSAVVGLAKTLADEVAADGVTVNNIAPGYFNTERLQQLMKARAEKAGISQQEQQDIYARNVPLGRIGDPMEFADFAAFLCSERAAYITGATFQIDGGLYRGMT